MNKMMSDWKETTLGEIATDIAYGYTESASIEPVGPKFLRITDIQDDFINWESVPYCPISENDHKKYKLEVGDVVIARTGNSTGATATIKKEVDAVFASYLIRFKIDREKADYLFIDFLLRSNYWKAFVNSVKGGSAQGGANARNFAEFPILLPPLTEQKAIAAILSSFDDKIELLRRQNKTLENFAQTIYKQWFVKFKVKSEKLKVNQETGLPEGWRIGKLKDFGEIICGKTPPKSINEYFGGGIPFIKIPDMHNDMYIVKTEDSLTEKGANYQSNKFVPKNSICVSCIATVGLVSITSQSSQTNQQINTIVPTKNEYLEYLYFVLKNMTDDLLAIGSGGSATLNINTGVFSDIEIMLPSNDIIKLYNLIAKPLFEKVLFNLKQIQTLSKLRDTLLPKLMKGEIRMKDSETLAEKS
ncbi:MAG: restriction endonuclease subunit S [Sedimentisphaerales bacterium]|nr:restriction endonuclease subunit S [Sedimentisphaerales bacterium]